MGKFFLVVAAIILVALGFAFSVFLLVAAAVIGVLLLGFLWWNARGVRRSRPRE